LMVSALSLFDIQKVAVQLETEIMRRAASTQGGGANERDEL
jgi:hypothetical protein